MVFKDRVLGRVFGSKREYVTGDWRCMLYSPHVYYSDDQIKEDEMSKGIWSIYGRREMLSWIE